MMMQTFLSMECLQLHKDIPAFKDPQDRQPESDKSKGPHQRGKFFRIVRLDHPAITGLLQWNLPASHINLDQRVDQPRHDSGSDERNQRIHSIDDKWPHPAADVM